MQCKNFESNDKNYSLEIDGTYDNNQIGAGPNSQIPIET
jgi:hypothetical protein